MKKIMIAAMSLSLLTGTAMFAQNSSTMSKSTMKKHKKSKKSTMTSTDTMSSPK